MAEDSNAAQTPYSRKFASCYNNILFAFFRGAAATTLAPPIITIIFFVGVNTRESSARHMWAKQRQLRLAGKWCLGAMSLRLRPPANCTSSPAVCLGAAGKLSDALCAFVAHNIRA